MITASVHIIGAKTVIRDLRQITDNLPKMSKRAAWNCAQIYASELRKEAAYHDQGTGYSKRTIRPVKIKGGYGVKVPYYWKFLEYGARPHFTRARKAVNWTMKWGRGRITTGGAVRIGTRPSHPINNSIIRARPRVHPMIKNEADRYIKSKGRKV